MFSGTEVSDTPLERKMWIRHLNALLETGTLNPDILPYCDYKQQFCLNEVKKYYARKKYSENVKGEDPDRDSH